LSSIYIFITLFLETKIYFLLTWQARKHHLGTITGDKPGVNSVAPLARGEE
jgi:hypothetical protein